MTDGRFSRDNQRISPEELAAWKAKAERRRQHRLRSGVRAEQYLGVKIPISWLAAAAALPGRSLAVGLTLWFLSGCRRNRTISLSGAALARLGVNRYAAYRGLSHLERAGLVHVRRLPGRNPIVTILTDENGKVEE